jgi:PIN domain nuclease of toxin-antitoxin system
MSAQLHVVRFKQKKSHIFLSLADIKCHGTALRATARCILTLRDSAI